MVSDVVANCCENFVNYQVDIHQFINKFSTVDNNSFHTSKIDAHKLNIHNNYIINKFYSKNGNVGTKSRNEGGGDSDGDGYDSWAC